MKVGGSGSMSGMDGVVGKAVQGTPHRQRCRFYSDKIAAMIGDSAQSSLASETTSSSIATATSPRQLFPCPGPGQGRARTDHAMGQPHPRPRQRRGVLGPGQHRSAGVHPVKVQGPRAHFRPRKSSMPSVGPAQSLLVVTGLSSLSPPQFIHAAGIDSWPGHESCHRPRDRAAALPGD